MQSREHNIQARDAARNRGNRCVAEKQNTGVQRYELKCDSHITYAFQNVHLYVYISSIFIFKCIKFSKTAVIVNYNLNLYLEVSNMQI